MKDVIIKNLVVLTILIFLLAIFLEFLNKILSGVPIYDKLNINRYQLTYIKSKNRKIDEEFIPRDESLIPKKTYLVNCGYQESGIYHQTFNPDLNGFWNEDINLYENTDIVMIGDSFAASSCVNYPHDLKSQIEKMSKNKILNLSPGASGPLAQLRIVEEYTQKTKFEKFIWFFYEGNDYGDLLLEINDNLFEVQRSFSPKLPISSIDLGTEGKKILKSKDEIFVDYDKLKKLIESYPGQSEDYKDGWNNETFLKIKIFIAERLRGMNSLIKYFIIKKSNEHLIHKDYERVVNRMDKYLTKKKINKRYICYLPKYTRIAHNKKNHPDIKKLNKLKNSVKTIGEKYNFEFIDASILFMDRENRLDIFPYQLPNHYNEKGYKLLAEYVSKSIL